MHASRRDPWLCKPHQCNGRQPQTQTDAAANTTPCQANSASKLSRPSHVCSTYLHVVKRPFASAVKLMASVRACRVALTRSKQKRHGNTAKGRSLHKSFGRRSEQVHSMTLRHTSAMPILDNLRARGLNVSRSLLSAGEESSVGTSTVGARKRGVLAAMKSEPSYVCRAPTSRRT